MRPNDPELKELEAEAERLTAYLMPHEIVACLLTVASMAAAFGAFVFVLVGWILGDVRLASLFWTTIVAWLIVQALTFRFRWNSRILTALNVFKLLVAHLVPVANDLDDARARLIVCRTQSARLKRSRR